MLATLMAASCLSLPWNTWQESSFLNHTPLLVVSPLPAQAVADFDGDHLLDRAELLSNGFQKNIYLSFSSYWRPSLQFSCETQQLGSIYAEDIDRDSDNDLIWVSDEHSTSQARFSPRAPASNKNNNPGNNPGVKICSEIPADAQ